MLSQKDCKFNSVRAPHLVVCLARVRIITFSGLTSRLNFSLNLFEIKVACEAVSCCAYVSVDSPVVTLMTLTAHVRSQIPPLLGTVSQEINCSELTFSLLTASLLDVVVASTTLYLLENNLCNALICLFMLFVLHIVHLQSKGQTQAKWPAARQFKHLPAFKTVFLLSLLGNTLNLSQLAKKCLEEELLHTKHKGTGLEPRDL